MTGKSKCKVLKQIRAEIAKNNDIEYIISECTFQGNCKGTCPKCEAEVKYLEEQLARRKALGKAVCVAGVAVSILTGCMQVDEAKTGQLPNETGGITSELNDGITNTPASTQEAEPLSGEVEMVSLPTETPKAEDKETRDLEGDVAWEGELEAPTETPKGKK